MLTSFRHEKASLQEKFLKEKQKQDDDMRTMQHAHEKELDDLRSKTTLKRLEVEKNFEEVKERLEKEKEKLSSKVQKLSD